MDEQRQDDQLEPIYNSSVSIQDVALLATWHDNDDEIKNKITTSLLLEL